jgi:hypothetical protein
MSSDTEFELDVDVEEAAPALFEEPPPDMYGYRKIAPGFWLNVEEYDLVSRDEDTVALVTWDGDRPGGGDLGQIDRHQDHYIFIMMDSDIWEYIGRFETTAEALAASNVLFDSSKATLNPLTQNWIGPNR